jgi:hypothetical protein
MEQKPGRARLRQARSGWGDWEREAGCGHLQREKANEEEEKTRDKQKDGKKHRQTARHHPPFRPCKYGVTSKCRERESK